MSLEFLEVPKESSYSSQGVINRGYPEIPCGTYQSTAAERIVCHSGHAFTYEFFGSMAQE